MVAQEVEPMQYMEIFGSLTHHVI